MGQARALEGSGDLVRAIEPLEASCAVPRDFGDNTLEYLRNLREFVSIGGSHVAIPEIAILELARVENERAAADLPATLPMA